MVVCVLGKADFGSGSLIGLQRFLQFGIENWIVVKDDARVLERLEREREKRCET